MTASQPSTPLNHQPGNALNPGVSAYHTGVGDQVSAPYATPVSPFAELAKIVPKNRRHHCFTPMEFGDILRSRHHRSQRLGCSLRVETWEMVPNPNAARRSTWKNPSMVPDCTQEVAIDAVPAFPSPRHESSASETVFHMFIFQ